MGMRGEDCWLEKPGKFSGNDLKAPAEVLTS
jgi:hypothetical protein